MAKSCSQCGRVWPDDDVHKYFRIGYYVKNGPVYKDICTLCTHGRPKKEDDTVPWQEDLEAQVITLLVRDGRCAPPTFVQLAELYGRTPQYWHEVQQNAFKKLRWFKHLEDYLQDDPGEPDPEIFLEAVDG